MLGYVTIVHIYFFYYSVFSFKARRGLQRQNCSQQNSAQANTARSHIFRKYLCENEFLRKTILAFYQGPRWVRFMKKNTKNLVTLPL